MRRQALLAIALAVGLAGCGSGGLFGDEEETKLPGERISILSRDADLVADPELAGEQPILAPARSGDWPQAYGGPAHAAGHRALAENPTVAWTADIGVGEDGRDQRIVYPPVAADGTVFVMDAAGVISAVDASDGDRKWRVDPAPEDEEDGFGGGLAYADGVLYLAAGFAQVVALDAATGDERWRATLPTPSRAAPAVADGRVFAVTIDNRLIALDAATGRQLWSFDSPPSSAALLGGAAPSAALGAVVAAMTTGEIIAFSATNGRLTWDDALTAVRRVGVAEAIPAARALPVIDDGQVVAVGAAGFAASIDFATGVRIWDLPIGGTETPAVSGDYIYLTTDQGRLVALRRADGRIVWTTDMRALEGDLQQDSDDVYARLFAGPTLAGGRVVVVRGDGRMLFFRPADGGLANSIRLPGRTLLAPIVANETLYVLTEAGALVAYR